MKRAYGYSVGRFFPALLILLALSVLTADAQESRRNRAEPRGRTEIRGKTEPNAKVADTSRYRYGFDISVNTLGFSIVLNGTELVSFEGGPSYSKSLDINDWMISGDNEFTITLFWPDNKKFNSGAASGLFALSSEKLESAGQGSGEKTELFSRSWPAPGAEENYPLSVSGRFKPDRFNPVLIERGELFNGVLSRSDQEEITAEVEKLRQAFAAKDLDAVNALFADKYADIAAARFLKPEEYRAEMDGFYSGLFAREAFTVRPLYSRYNFQSAAAGRLVKVMQGSLGFPEPALIMSYRENRRTLRYDLDLYFAKIGGRWVIVR
ncbi:MAG: hypothetical protein LBQ44_10530 [Treponema sp.]|jgi:hypothetical protein|nr:hypothetical protein [Treponema sp.]